MACHFRVCCHPGADGVAASYVGGDIGRSPDSPSMGAHRASDLDGDVLLFCCADAGCSVAGITDQRDADDGSAHPTAETKKGLRQAWLLPMGSGSGRGNRLSVRSSVQGETAHARMEPILPAVPASRADLIHMPNTYA